MEEPSRRDVDVLFGSVLVEFLGMGHSLVIVRVQPNM